MELCIYIRYVHDGGNVLDQYAPKPCHCNRSGSARIGYADLGDSREVNKHKEVTKTKVI